MLFIKSGKLLFYSNVHQLGKGFVRTLNTCPVNRQIASPKNNEECPITNKQYGQDSNQMHCTSEEWANAKPFKDIPGPNPLPIIGNTWRFIPGIGKYGNALKTGFIDMIKLLTEQYGEIIRVEKVIGFAKSVHLHDPAEIEKVYKLEGVIPERDVLPSISYFRDNMRQDLFKNNKGLLTSQGKDWHDFRNKVNTIMMQPKIIKQYVSPVDNIAKELMERIKSIRNKDNKITKLFSKELNKWALETIAYLALDRRLGCLRGNLPDDSAPAKMIKLAEDVFTYSAKLDFRPSPWKYIATPTYKKTMKLYEEQTNMIEALVKEAMEDINKKKDKINTNDEYTEPSVLEKLLKVDEKVAIVMSIDMVGAGVDTTSTALVNILYYLASNKPKQEILKKEILKHLPNDDSVLTVEMLNSMPYLKACIKEAARIYPVTPGTMRYLTKDAVLSGYQVPKGTQVMFMHQFISMNKKYFPNPEEYIPERWLRDNMDSDISYKRGHPFCTMHFGFGNRSCVGRRFADLELEVAVINFMRHFDLSWEGPRPIRKTTSINYLAEPFNFIFKDAKK